MNFQELGLTLKHERERQGLSVEVVMEATKISRTNIVAMENGDRDTLPHPVYTKGFIKSYARYLGLDPDEFSMIVDREYQNEIDGPEEQVYEVSAAAEKAFQDPDSSERKGKSKLPLLLVFVFLVAIVVLLVMNFNGEKDSEPVEEATTSAEIVKEEPTAAPTVMPEEATSEEQSEATSDGADAPDESAATEEQPTESPVTDDSQAQAEQPEQPAVAEQEAPTAAAQPEQPVVPAKPVDKPKSETVAEAPAPVEDVATKPADQKYDHLVVIRATTEKGCWIGLWKGDEKNMYRDYVLKEGEPLRLMFNTLRRIRIGNVAGVTVSYNGKPYALDATKGNIQTLRFGE